MTVSHADRPTVLITGASAGIGKCCAERLASAGWRVFAVSRSAPAATAYETLRINIDNEESVRKCVTQVLERSGRIDAVINNAAINVRGSVEDVSIDEAKQIFETNFFGVIRVCQATLPAVRSRKGVIINIGSFAGSVGMQFGGHYAASKFALHGMTESLRRELAPLGVRVVNIAPGLFKTKMAENLAISSETRNGAYAAQFDKFLINKDRYLKNLSTPEPVAVLVEKILNSGDPKGYYFVGPLYQRILLLTKRVLPQGLFEAITNRAFD